MSDAIKLISEHEQDMANALKWWDTESDIGKMRLWMSIQNMGGTAELELISRMAQLGYTQLALTVAERDAGEGK